MPAPSRLFSLLLACLAAPLVFAAQDIRLEMSGGIAHAGELLTVPVTLWAQSPGSGPITFTAAVPDGTTFASMDPDPRCVTPAAGGTGTITCTFPTLAPFSNLILSIRLNVPPGAADSSTIIMTATAASEGDPNPANNTATASFLVYGPADVGIAVDTPAVFTAGAPHEYAVSITNHGPAPAHDFFLLVHSTGGTAQDLTFAPRSVPAGMTCSFSGSEARCSMPLVAASASMVLQVEARPYQAATKGVDVEAISSVRNTDPVRANDRVFRSMPTRLVSDAALTVSAPAAVTVGSDVAITIDAVTSGPSFAAVQLTADIPPGSVFVSLQAPRFMKCTTPSAGGTGRISCTMALAAAVPWDHTPAFPETVTLTVRPTVLGPLAVAATLTSTLSADENPTNDSAAATVQVMEPPPTRRRSTR